MHPQQVLMIVLNVLGGIAVLGSYAYGLSTHPNAGELLWGGVPAALKPIYTASMLLAAAGYFPFTYYLLFCVDAARARFAGGFGFGWFNVFYLLVLIPSALWLPLTFRIIGQWDASLWIAIRLVLAAVAVGSLGLLGGLLTLERPPARLLRILAIAGAIAFCLQTALLDALVWPAYFPGDRIPMP